MLVVEIDDPLAAARRVADLGGGRESGEVRRLLIERGLIHRLRSGSALEPRGGVYAVDSAFPRSPSNLVGYSLSLVAVAAAEWFTGERVVKRWLLVERFRDLDQDFVAGFARLQERNIALSLDPWLLVLDGEILPRRGRSGLWEQARTASLSLVASVSSKCGAVAGVLKRSYSRTVSSALGLEVSDRVLATLGLERGEAIIVSHGDRVLAERGCVEAFYKPLRGLPVAVKVEACCSRCVDCLDLLSFLASETSATGLPWAIDLVDGIVKREVALLDSVERHLLSMLARGFAAELGVKANPQEQGRRPGVSS